MEPRRIGDYEYLKNIAVTHMAQVWLVRHVNLSVQRAAKLLLPHHRRDPEFVKRFLHEARYAANLHHPNIVQIHDFDESVQAYYMEYVKGADLEDILSSERATMLTLGSKTRIIRCATEAVAYAHEMHNLVHRDIKPSNILLGYENLEAPAGTWQVKLTDFGIARILDLDTRLKLSSTKPMGTVHYMAPEQFDGDVRKASDVYSLGVVFYQLLVGHVPFQDDIPGDARQKHKHEDPLVPSEIHPEIPIEYSAVVMKCLEKDPDSRYQDACELLGALKALPDPPDEPPAAQEPVVVAAGASEVIALQKTLGKARKKPRRRGRRRLLGLGLLLVLAAAGAAVLTHLDRHPRYCISWVGMSSDPLDTPNGIDVHVSPYVGTRPLLWWRVGHIDEGRRNPESGEIEAGSFPPQDWANWTTHLPGVYVKLSDRCFRSFVLLCRPADAKKEEGSDGLPVVRFGKVTFDDLRSREKGRAVSDNTDLSRIGAYVDAVLTPRNIHRARCLMSVERSLARMEKLMSEAPVSESAKSHFGKYQRAVSSLRAEANCLANGEIEEAGKRRKEAEDAMPGLRGLSEDRRDFLFADTLLDARERLKVREKSTVEKTASLKPESEGAESRKAMDSTYQLAASKVASYVRIAPGKRCFDALLTGKDEQGAQKTDAGTPGKEPQDKKGPGPPTPEGVERRRRESTIEDQVLARGKDSRVIRIAKNYLEKLDALLDHAPAKEGDKCAYRVAVLQLLDKAYSPFEEAARTREPYMVKCFAEEELGFLGLVRTFWHHVHQKRAERAAHDCLEAGEDRIRRALSYEPKAVNRPLAEQAFAEAEACLMAIENARLTGRYKPRGTELAGDCDVHHARWLFRCGPEDGAKEKEYYERIRSLLVPGLRQASADAKSIGNALAKTLERRADARAKINECLEKNFGTPGAYEGSEKVLFDALRAYVALDDNVRRPYHADPVYPTLRKPFLDMQSRCCQGFRLWNAACCWLLGKAMACCARPEPDYVEACRYLGYFELAPKREGNDEKAGPSPLQKLVASDAISRALKLREAAKCFDTGDLVKLNLPSDEKWRRIWESRLKARDALANMRIPQRVAPDTVADYDEEQKDQWQAIFTLLDSLRGFYMAKLDAESGFGALEKATAAIAREQDGKSVPDLKACTPDERTRVAASLAEFSKDTRYHGDNYPWRVRKLDERLGALDAAVRNQREKLDHLVQNDPKKALDELDAWKAVLGEDDVLGYATKALDSWMAQAADLVSKKQYDAALAEFGQIGKHQVIAKHRADPHVAQQIARAALGIHYCTGQQLLSQGRAKFKDARLAFEQAGTYGDAESILAHLRAFLEALETRDATPFQARTVLSALLKNDALHAKVKEEAEQEVHAIESHVAASASAAVGKFNDALRSKNLDALRSQVVPALAVSVKFADLERFAKGVGAVKVEAPEIEQAKPLWERKQVVLTQRRVVTFVCKPFQEDVSYKQSLKWTVGYVPPKQPGTGRWEIVDWEEVKEETK